MSHIPQSLIHVVSEECSIRKCREYIHKGFDVNTQNEVGSTLLMYASMPNEFGDLNSPSASEAMINFLVSQGANPNLTDSFGKKAVDYAKTNVDPDHKDVFGDALRFSKDDILVWRRIIAMLESLPS